MANQRLTNIRSNAMQLFSTLFLLMYIGTAMGQPLADPPKGAGNTEIFHLGNNKIAWRGRLIGRKFRGMVILDHVSRGHMRLETPYFRIVLGNGKTVTSSDFVLSKRPEARPLNVNADSPKLADHFPGHAFDEYLVDKREHLSVQWSLRLRENANYLREQLVLHALGGHMLIKQLTFLHQIIRGAKVIGTVPGSPVVAGNFFTGYENPMADNTVSQRSLTACSFAPYEQLASGQQLSGSCVIGVVPQGQLRRGFMAYLDMERCHPYRPFLHYNSWYDIGNLGGKYNQIQCIHAINTIGKQLVVKRGVKLASFLFDDGWDNNKTLWKFNRGFPDGFTPLDRAAARYHAGVLGFYPVNPVTGVYVLGSPRIDRASINIPGTKRTFSIIADNNNPQNVFIKSVKLNGRNLDRTWITHEEIVQGGVLHFNMARKPNKEWGLDASARPTSGFPDRVF